MAVALNNRFYNFFLNIWSVSFAILALSSVAFGQTVGPVKTPPAIEEEAIKVRTNLVRVEVNIIDGKGNPVKDIKASEIHITQDGVPQEVKDFSFVSSDSTNVNSDRQRKGPPRVDRPVASGAPRDERSIRWIAIVFDDLSIAFENVNWAKKALTDFIDKQLSPGDRVALISTSGVLAGNAQIFIDNKDHLLAQINQLRFNHSGGAGATSNPAFRSSVLERVRASGGAVSQEAIDDDKRRDREAREDREDVFAARSLRSLYSILSRMAQIDGQKSVFLLSDGYRLVNKSLNGFEDVSPVAKEIGNLVNFANRSSIAIHTFDTSGVINSGFTSEDDTTVTRLWRPTKGNVVINAHDELIQGRRQLIESKQNGLMEIAERTGATYQINSNNLSRGLTDALSRNDFYLVSYEPKTDIPENGGKLKIIVSRPGVSVRHRESVLRLENASSYRSLSTHDLEMLPYDISDLSVSVTPLYAHDESEGSFLRVIVNIAPSSIFNEEDQTTGNRDLEVRLACFASDGKRIFEASAENRSELSDDVRSLVLRNGFFYTFVVPLESNGFIRIRGVVRDRKTGEAGTASKYIEVPNIGKGQTVLSSIVLDTSSNEDSATDGEDRSNRVIEYNSLVANSRKKFEAGSTIVYGFAIYSNISSRMSSPSSLEVELLSSNGSQVQAVYKGPAMTPNSHTGSLTFPKNIPPGRYTLKVSVRRSDKKRVETQPQTVDFEIIKSFSLNN